jgi:sugar phosphate isomerase/epimerase
MTPPSSVPNRDLLATCWTWSGDSAPFRGDEISPLDLRTRIETTAQAGWAGLGILHADLQQAKLQIGFGELKKIIAGAGISIIELEFLANWWTTGGPREESDRWRTLLFESAAALGATTIKVGGDLSPDPVALDVFTEAFAELASDAGEHGLRVALEPMSMNNLQSLERGIQVVTEVQHPAGGLCVDVCHVHRGGTPYSSLPEILPIESVFVVELADSREKLTGADLWQDAINHRLNPGEGDFDVPTFVADMVEAGWAGCWGVEVISEVQRQLPLDVAVHRTHQVTSTVLDVADQILRTRRASTPTHAQA